LREADLEKHLLNDQESEVQSEKAQRTSASRDGRPSGAAGGLGVRFARSFALVRCAFSD